MTTATKDIFENRNFRLHGPETSRLAAAFHDPVRPGNCYRVWFKLFEAAADCTALELYWRFPEYWVQHGIDPVEIRRRLYDLGHEKNRGPIKALMVGTRKCTCNKRKGQVWTAVGLPGVKE